MRRTLSVIGGLVLAVVLSQFPEYAQQYEQRLGGAVDELRIITEEFEQAATQSGLSRQDAIGRFAATSDTFIQGRGVSTERTFERYELLRRTLAEIQGATGWQRFTLLPSYLDTDIGRRTLENFQPAVPVTLEGFAYAAAGFLIGYFLISGLVRFLLLPFRRRRRRDDEEEVEYLPSPPPRARLEAVLAPRTEPEVSAAVVPEVRLMPVEAEPLPVVDADPEPERPIPAPPRPEPRPSPPPQRRDESRAPYIHPAVAAARRRSNALGPS